MQRFCGASLRTLIAEDALRPVFPLAGFFVDRHIHGADPQALPTMDAFALIAVDAQQRKITHGLEKHRDRAQILTERPVILEDKGKRNACNVVKHISGEKQCCPRCQTTADIAEVQQIKQVVLCQPQRNCCRRR